VGPVRSQHTPQALRNARRLCLSEAEGSRLPSFRTCGLAERRSERRRRCGTPADTFGATVPALARLRAVPRTREVRGSSRTLEGEIPAARVHEVEQRLPALTRGEGVLLDYWKAPSVATNRSAAPSRPGRGQTTTRSTARSTCRTPRGGSSAADDSSLSLCCHPNGSWNPSSPSRGHRASRRAPIVRVGGL
jgi:hypothetical protein